MDGINEFFAMGGHAGYVWPAYAVTAIVMLGVLVASLKGRKTAESQLKRLQESRPRRSRRAQPELGAELNKDI